MEGKAEAQNGEVACLESFGKEVAGEHLHVLLSVICVPTSTLDATGKAAMAWRPRVPHTPGESQGSAPLWMRYNLCPRQECARGFSEPVCSGGNCLPDVAARAGRRASSCCLFPWSSVTVVLRGCVDCPALSVWGPPPTLWSLPKDRAGPGPGQAALSLSVMGHGQWPPSVLPGLITP